jgi:hypothetical protein
VGQPLDGAWAKITRAYDHFDCLKAEINAADYSDSLSFRQQYDVDAGTIEITIEGVRELPIKWALDAGDILQNLRAALNYLAWELARWNLAQRGETRDPSDATQFPINTTGPTPKNPTAFSERYVEDLHPDHVARIKALQPNGAWHLEQFPEFVLLNSDVDGLAAGHPLAKLAALTNVDKHKILQPALIGLGSTVRYVPPEVENCVVIESVVHMPLTLENGAQWLTLQVTPTGSGEPKVKMKNEITVGVTFGGSEMTEDFAVIAATVVEIVREFEPVF